MPSKQPAAIHLEGATLEGGGQLLRIALGLSSLTKKPVSITNIRGKRSAGGGLKAQHLTSMLWLGQACNARISGAGLRSKEITFTPNPLPSIHQDITVGHVSISQSTPGSINLVLQAVLPYLLFSGAQDPIQLRITGGTNVSNSPSYDYVEQVLIPMLSIVGVPSITTSCHSRGWSTGSTRLGSVTFTVTPLTTTLPAFQLTDRGIVKSIRATVVAPRDSEQGFRDNLDLMFEKRLARIFSGTENPEIHVTFEDSHHEKRYYLLLVATTSTGLKLGRDWLYDRGVRTGKTTQVIPNIVRKVSDDLITEIEHGGCVDEWMMDQLVVFQALAKGKSRVNRGRRGGRKVETSLHAQTAMWVAERIIDVKFDGEGGCEGMGFSPGSEQGDVEESALVEGVSKLEVST
ncbi:RNA 3'-terminal phosphate cyclase [Macroventuria anomochaeta]|uniref:RNA 3'-terminal phosphate cyclase n=1 Tax=Macroventuria anomochaeta TaxID=301207 RepID=A0ACB6SBP1_9PLEO|nr:RNA 3'-terminal phosphate cyclase [Macroventuria anomochaeta]KAF2631474.1 RNA 3'-terminal phosphate cyclase [Macroventuria anomochaeta]